jgi:hypothetical protein
MASPIQNLINDLSSDDDNVRMNARLSLGKATTYGR